MPLLSRRLSLLPLLLGCVMPYSLLAASTVSVALDPGRTRIEWTLHGNVHEVHGTFRLKQGSVRYDTGTGTAQGEVVVDANTGESGEGARDKRMRSSILETGRYPDVRFVPERFSPPVGSATEFTTTVSGSFTLHGVAHALAVPLTVKIANGELTASGSFSVPYVEWGLKDPSTFIFRVDKKVELHVTAVGRISQ